MFLSFGAANPSFYSYATQKSLPTKSTLVKPIKNKKRA